MREISVEEFDARFDELMASVEAGESFALTRRGKAVAILRKIERAAQGEASNNA